MDVDHKDTESRGIALALAKVDGVKKAIGNAPIASLKKDGMEVLKTTLAYIPTRRLLQRPAAEILRLAG